jgi:uncharacterized protein YegP (UPF0339 family)
VIEAIKRMFGRRGPTFEVQLNQAGAWFWHERAVNGQIKDVSQAYASKSSAVRAARRKVAETLNAKLKIFVS